ncbi:MAG: DegT/DnrJ/EryC1/StrS family aminotransferase [Candidatus Diapherotrites archaeon]
MIRLSEPFFDSREAKAVARVLKSRYIISGPKTREFEKKFSSFIGTRFALGTDSCTSALHLSLEARGVKGSEVITTPMTFVSTAHAIIFAGAKPVFADVEPGTLNLSPSAVEEKISPRTKAILLVHYRGHCCEMNEFKKIAKRNGIPLVEDCAHATGAEFRGKKAGSFGAASCFSFRGGKNISAGDAGAICFSRASLKPALERLRFLGVEREKDFLSYNVKQLGFKAQMNDIDASICLEQLKKLKFMNKRRAEIARQYDEAFSSLGWLEPLEQRKHVKSSNYCYTLKVLNGKRDALSEFLRSKEIESTVYYKPLPLFSFYKKFPHANLPVAMREWKRILSLPLHPALSAAEVSRVINAVKLFGKKFH